MRHFHEQLQDVLKQITLMGALTDSMISLAMRALVERDESLVDEVYRREDEVNALQVHVDEQVVELTATQQPVGKDLRFLFTATKIVTDLERIADQAKNICQSAHWVLAQPPLKPMVDLPIMAEIAQRMVKDALTAVIERDVPLAERIIREESKVDAFRDQIFRTLLTYMMADPGTIQRALSLILISRNIERIGDHATNIAEEAIYIVQGRDIRHAAAAAATNVNTDKGAA
ncbi:MAG TPA: phosphate signaling complex protein PhoU [Tepidisphaeraceae bacterium]|jgi:phosphate transport system protein